MIAPPRGWCPSLFAPMQSGDGWLLRVKPRAATLTAGQAQAVAAAALRHGNGWLNLTNRGNLQLRGITMSGLDAVAEAMLAAGLASPDPAVEARRTLLAPALLGDDPALDPHLAGLLEALEAVLAEGPALPSKFGLLVDGGGRLPLVAERADIAVLARGEVALALDGGDLLARTTWAEAPAAVARLLRVFMALSQGEGRMRAMVARHGARTVFAAAGLDAVPGETPAASPVAVGMLAYPGLQRGAFGAGLPLGRLAAATLAALAVLAVRHGDGTLRVTPWRSLVLPGVTDQAAVRADTAALGCIVDPADPRLRILACPGQPGCGAATVDTGADVARLLAAGGIFRDLLHVSGCAKGCAHPGPAALTLVGEAGRYGLVRGGTARQPPERSGLTIEQAAVLLGGFQETA